MQLIFNKLGRGCEGCVAKPSGCPTCERNVGLYKLTDNYQRPPTQAEIKAQTPSVGLPDDTLKASEANKGELAAWGIRHKPKPPRKPPPPSQQEPPSPDGAPPDLEDR